MIDSDSRIRKASRRVGRETPNCSMSTDSFGNGSPAPSSPVMIRRRRFAATSSPALGTRTTVDFDPTATLSLSSAPVPAHARTRYR